MLRSAVLLMLVAAPVAKLDAWVSTRDNATSRELHFTDDAGVHLVRFELGRESTVTRDESVQRSRELSVVHTIAKRKGEVFRTRDWVKGCEFELSLEFIDESIRVTDLDGDGIAEVAFAYRLGCRSDVSPLTVKWLLYEGSDKYALRGTSRERVSETEWVGGEFTADPAFDQAPAFLTHATEQWRLLK